VVHADDGRPVLRVDERFVQAIPYLLVLMVVPPICGSNASDNGGSNAAAIPPTATGAVAAVLSIPSDPTLNKELYPDTGGFYESNTGSPVHPKKKG